MLPRASWGYLPMLVAAIFMDRSRVMAFSPLCQHRHTTIISTTSIFGQNSKKKPSMSERRAARSRRRKASPDTSQLPKSKIPNALAQPRTTAGNDKSITENITQDYIQKRKIEEASKEVTEASKAKKLVEAQKESVAMLTAVAEAINRLPIQDILHNLSTKRFWYGDDFLGDNDIISKLRNEGKQLFPSMEKDAETLMSGEFVAAIQGGPDQYKECPRSIEWVVAVTKHLPSRLTDASTLDTLPTVSASNCMASMRTFDRKALEASVALLTGEKDQSTIESLIEEMSNNSSTQPFEPTVQNSGNDKRRLSLRYYLVPNDWWPEYGGGLTVHMTDSDDNSTIVAKSDRLVIWMSDTSTIRKNPWLGSSDHDLSSCIELHLVTED